jgi:methylase of polypeptide subunit release factors
MFLPNPGTQRVQKGAPPPQSKGFNPKTDFTAAQVFYSDDGRTALVEFVANDPDALKEILASRVPGVKAFERGRTTKQEVEAEFRKYKPNFSIDAVNPGRAQ